MLTLLALAAFAAEPPDCATRLAEATLGREVIDVAEADDRDLPAVVLARNQARADAALVAHIAAALPDHPDCTCADAPSEGCGPVLDAVAERETCVAALLDRVADAQREPNSLAAKLAVDRARTPVRLAVYGEHDCACDDLDSAACARLVEATVPVSTVADAKERLGDASPSIDAPAGASGWSRWRFLLVLGFGILLVMSAAAMFVGGRQKKP